MQLFRTFPGKWSTRIMVLSGLVIFGGLYSWMLRIFDGIHVVPADFNVVWTSFDVEQFRGFVGQIANAGNLDVFLQTFAINIFSILAFMVAFTGLGLMAARSVPPESKFYGTAYIFPWLVVGVAFLDITSSLLILLVAEGMIAVLTWQVQVISGFYLGRVLLLYTYLIWLIVISIRILRFRLKGNQT